MNKKYGHILSYSFFIQMLVFISVGMSQMQYTTRTKITDMSIHMNHLFQKHLGRICQALRIGIIVFTELHVYQNNTNSCSFSLYIYREKITRMQKKGSKAITCISKFIHIFLSFIKKVLSLQFVSSNLTSTLCHSRPETYKHLLKY